MEHPENKINRYFGNKVGPGVLHSNVQETCTLQESHTKTTESRNSQWLMLCAFNVFEVVVLFERWTGALQVLPRFGTAQIVY